MFEESFEGSLERRRGFDEVRRKKTD